MLLRSIREKKDESTACMQKNSMETVPLEKETLLHWSVRDPVVNSSYCEEVSLKIQAVN